MPVCFSVFDLFGLEGKQNKVLYRGPIIQENHNNENYERKNEAKKKSNRFVIFFPGDYSNFFCNTIYTACNVQKKFECTTYCYSYEALFWVVSSKYLFDHLVFITPSCFDTYFAVFENFVYPTSRMSIKPETEEVTDKETKSVEHLMRLLDSLKREIETNDTFYLNKEKTNELILIGFSKGCSVLISLLKEINEKYKSFWETVHSFIFLDPPFNRFIIDISINEECIRNLKEFCIPFFIHSTPRQILGFTEKGKEINKMFTNFIDSLKKYNIEVYAYLHYEYVPNSVNSLHLHFEILVDFFDDDSLNTGYVSAIMNQTKQKEEENLKPKYKKNIFFENWSKYCAFDEVAF